MRTAKLDISPVTDVLAHLRRWRLRLLWQRLLSTTGALALLLLIAVLLEYPFVNLLPPLFIIFLISFSQLYFSAPWRRLTPENFLQHLNRRFSDFEESAQLLLQDPEALTGLQFLQRERVLAVYQQNLYRIQHWQAPVHYRLALTVFISCMLLVLYSDQVRQLPGQFLSRNLEEPAVLSPQNISAGISGIDVLIRPPVYTGLKPTTADQLDLELVEGSHVQWMLSFEHRNPSYALELSNDRQIPLSPGDDRYLHASATINKTSLYRVISLTGRDKKPTGGIHSLTVTLDQAPVIRILEPVVSTLDIPSNGLARFTSQVLVTDDYGVQNVDILGSVAKGSGEGVKFRDQTLSFDAVTETDKGLLFHREWDLQKLGMEPGDEIYFTVLASDNKEPQANTGRSATLIVRWLEDGQAGLTAEGLAIDFIPELFKSQRQIIIETEQLIGDESRLSLQEYKDNSYTIGQAQADLKQKYGQYLGDEFGEGPGEQLGIMHEIAEQTDDDQDSHQGDHDPAQAGITTKNLTSTADILKLFGHDHGDPEIGPITRRNPVALMKRAVSEMWQAEKHLMQAEPVQALAFEYEAYKFLKLARQADRIYVRRLGFEPPPVSEERRLSGELDEILSYRVSEPEVKAAPGYERWQQDLLINTYQLISKHSLQTNLDEKDRQLLHDLSVELTARSQMEPFLIKHAATVEKLLLAGHLDLNDCEKCVQDLATTVWRLITHDNARLHHRRATWQPGTALILDYLEESLTETDSEDVAPKQSGDLR